MENKSKMQCVNLVYAIYFLFYVVLFKENKCESLCYVIIVEVK